MIRKEFETKDGQKLIIREPKKEDAQRVIDFIKQVDRETVFLIRDPGEFNYTVEEELEFFKKHRESDNEIFFIAELNGDVVGTIGITAGKQNRIKHTGNLGIAVKKSAWEKGIGSTMMQTLLEWAKDNKIIRKINLTVHCDNERAQNLYRKFGFKKEGESSRGAIIDGQFYSNILMGLEID
jgi:RimJ/RimL family protein N-acetyltransferase